MVRAPLIAIADDDTAFANYLKTFLDARGYLARVYSHGEDLLAAAYQGQLLCPLEHHFSCHRA